MKRNQSLLLLALLLGLAANLNMVPSAEAAANNPGNAPSLFNMQEAYSNGLTNNGEAVKLAEAGKCGKGSCGAEMKKEVPTSKCSKGKCSKAKCSKTKCSKAKCSKTKCAKKATH